MLRVGLTGGIGAGKSEVARLLAGHGAYVVDADVVAREVVAPGTPGLERIVQEFGHDVLQPDGSLDRKVLAARVFSDAPALARLNGIVHPLVAARSAELVRGLPDETVVVNDVPLLVENGLAGAYDVVVVVDAPQDVRLERIVARGIDAADGRARMRAQATDDERLAVADHVIDNSGDLELLAAAVSDLWLHLTDS